MPQTKYLNASDYIMHNAGAFVYNKPLPRYEKFNSKYTSPL